MRALGMIEVLSIPAGIEAGDRMLKAAEVELVFAQPVCAGKYIVVITGEVAAVRHAVEAGVQASEYLVVNTVIIPNVHETVPAAINACTEIREVAAIGVMETFSLCTALIVADTVVKAADISLIEVRLGRGMGGKSFLLFTGDVAAVKAAVEAGSSVEEAQGLLSGSVVIPSPHPDLVKALV